MRYKTKPCEIEAIQLTPQTYEQCLKFVGESSINNRNDQHSCFIGLKTLEGDFGAMHGDFIIKGLKGEFYPCKPNIFNMKYELIN